MIEWLKRFFFLRKSYINLRVFHKVCTCWRCTWDCRLFWWLENTEIAFFRLNNRKLQQTIDRALYAIAAFIVISTFERAWTYPWLNDKDSVGWYRDEPFSRVLILLWTRRGGKSLLREVDKDANVNIVMKSNLKEIVFVDDAITECWMQHGIYMRSLNNAR